jgi:hypothetical protein
MATEKITQLAQSLLDCVTARLIADGSPVCESCVVAGDRTPPMDGCDCTCDAGQGRAWIRVVDVEFQGYSDYRSANSQVEKCPTGAWNIHFETGVYRCIRDTLDGNCDDKLADAQAMHADMASLINGIACCPEVETARWSPEKAEALGPAGGCAGAIYTFLIQIDRLQAA